MGPAPRHLSPGPRVQPALWQGREVLDLASTVPSQVLSGASMLASPRSSLARGAGTGCPLSRVFRRRRHRQLLCVGDLVAAKLGDFPGSRPCLTGAQGPEWEGRAARGRHLLGPGRARLSSHGDSPRLLAAIGAYMAVAPAPAASPLEGLCGLCPPGSSGPACSGRAPVSGPSRRDLAPPFPRGVVPISQRSGGQARISCEACSMAEAAAEPPSWGMKGPEPPRLRGWDCFMLYQVAVEWKACASQENERTPMCPHVPVTSLWGRSSGTEGRRRAGSAVRAQHRLDLGATLRTLPEKRGR